MHQHPNEEAKEEGCDDDHNNMMVMMTGTKPSISSPYYSNSELIALFDDFMHCGNIGLHIVNEEGFITWANQAELDFLGYTAEEYVGKHIQSIHHDKNCVSYIITTLLAGEQVRDYIAPLITKDGRIEYVQINSSMRCHNGVKTTRCFSAVVTDRVLREQREAALRKEQNERKTMFVRKLCHELRNPLHGIKGNLDLLLDSLCDLQDDTNQWKQKIRKQKAKERHRADDKGEAAASGAYLNASSNDDNRTIINLQNIEERIKNALEYAESAQLATEHQMVVINETLSLERLESGNGGLESYRVRRVVMDDMIRQVQAIMGVKAFEKGLDVQFHIVNDHAKQVRTDPVWLKQILINLLSNAIKFTHHGQIIVTIDTTEYHPSNNNNSVHKDHNMALKVTVKDDGIGMTFEEQQKLFGVFVQANDHIVSEFGGSGLGLHIIQQMLQYLDGSIQIIQSIQHVGSTFQFIMPCQKSNDNILSSSSSHRHRHHPKKPVAVFDLNISNHDDKSVDDNVLSRIHHKELNESTSLITKDIVVVASSTTILPSSSSSSSSSSYNKSITFASKEVQDAASADEVAEPSVLSLDKANTRILVVDDSPINVKVLCHFLRTNGYRNYETAQHGKEALEMHQSNPFDIIMTDIDMPIMDGLELTKQIRSYEKEETERTKKRAVHIIGISGNVLPEDLALATQVGMNEYIGKPYSFQTIQAMLENSIRKRRI